MVRRVRGLVPLLLAVVVVAGACGNGDDDDDGAVGGSTTTRAGATTTRGGATTTVPSFEAGTTMAQLQSEGKIVVGTKFDQPGLGQKNALTDEVEGFDVEIAKLIAVGIFGGSVDDLGDKIEFIESTTPNREAFIENGTVDIVVATYTINDARKERISFAGPYYVAGQDILTKADDTSINGIEDLAGKRVCSVRNSTPAENLMERAPDADLTLFDTYSLCIEALRDGRTDAVSTDNSILLGFIDANPGEFRITGEAFTEEPYGIGLSKDDTEFRMWINDRLEEIYASGEWAEAFESTLGEFGVVTPEPPEVDRYEE